MANSHNQPRHDPRLVYDESRKFGTWVPALHKEDETALLKTDVLKMSDKLTALQKEVTDLKRDKVVLEMKKRFVTQNKNSNTGKTNGATKRKATRPAKMSQLFKKQGCAEMAVPITVEKYSEGNNSQVETMETTDDEGVSNSEHSDDAKVEKSAPSHDDREPEIIISTNNQEGDDFSAETIYLNEATHGDKATSEPTSAETTRILQLENENRLPKQAQREKESCKVVHPEPVERGRFHGNKRKGRIDYRGTNKTPSIVPTSSEPDSG
ncbi:unnamed protein product [Orchesella dallaii]|uniref:Uncharacterized protein n=1 Tax=Orchesella dallaii TaxID=48710 RepID=A0ABP1PS47_9HEXA